MVRKVNGLPAWADRTVVIIGGGPSLSLKQIRHIARARLQEQCRVVAVNDAIFVAWFADWLHGCDSKWWNWHRNTATKFGGWKTTMSETVLQQWADGFFKGTGEDGFDPEIGNARTGGNGVYQVMHTCIQMRVRKIVLVGVDMKFDDNGDPHWHGHHPDRITTDFKETMVPNFPTLEPILKERSIRVVNCSPGTALDTFPTGSLDIELPIDEGS